MYFWREIYLMLEWTNKKLESLNPFGIFSENLLKSSQPIQLSCLEWVTMKDTITILLIWRDIHYQEILKIKLTYGFLLIMGRSIWFIFLQNILMIWKASNTTIFKLIWELPGRILTSNGLFWECIEPFILPWRWNILMLLL